MRLRLSPLVRGFLRSGSGRLVLASALAVALAAVAGLAYANLSTSSGLPAGGHVANGSVDTDGDGLSDLEESVSAGTDPRSADTDGDGLPDVWEVTHRTTDPRTRRSCPDPIVPDATRDCQQKGMTLAEDHALGTDPRSNDTDADGIPDAYERAHGMDTLSPDADAEPFDDGLTNRQRYATGARADRIDTACSGMTDARKVALGLNPSRASTGGSGVPDGWALFWDLDPRDPMIGTRRLDGDPHGLTVLEKAQLTAARRSICATPEEREPSFASGFDPRRADSDDDGLPDAWEIRYGLDPLDVRDAARDADGDGMSSLEAFREGGCPDRRDCDDDGVPNADELRVGWIVRVDGTDRRVHSDPLRAVTDVDRMPDGVKRAGAWEVDGRTLRFPPLDPTTADTDGDGIQDASEVSTYAGALDPTRSDTDGDGLPDGEEVAMWDALAAAGPERAHLLCAMCSAHGGATANVAAPDADGDGLSDGDELRPSMQPVKPGALALAPFPPSDPSLSDGDGDGLPDAWERRRAWFDADVGRWNLDPSRSDSDGDGVLDGAQDHDRDGLATAAELAAGTDPHAADTDGDGLPDGWEALYGVLASARFAGSAPRGAAFEWHPAAGSASPLSPLENADAARVVATYRYTRPLREAGLNPWEEIDPARGEHAAASMSWTYLDLHQAGLQPLAAASTADGIPDVVKLLWASPAWGGEGAYTVGDASDGARDDDRDGLTNAEEFEVGTSPVDPDTDLGGLKDGDERLAALDPFDAADDGADGDFDQDGLSNTDELRVSLTRLDDVDTDGDGLLDGPDVVLSTDPGDAETRVRLDALLARGIARQADGGSWRFLGEHRVTTDPSLGCARVWSCSGDGLPDAWKVYHGIAPLAFHAPSEDLMGDGVGLLAKYAWGRPTDWSEENDGPWWLGLPPRVRATPEMLVDLDADGLHDAHGEDPHPYFDRENVGIDPRDRAATFDALLARDAAPTPAPARVNATIELDGLPPAEAEKGASFQLAGRLRLSEGGPPPRTLVLARLAAPGGAGPTTDPGRVDGVARTDADGRFNLTLLTAREHGVSLDEAPAAFLARPGSANLTWTRDTSELLPGVAHDLSLWSYAQPERDRVAGGGARSFPAAVRLASTAALDAPLELTARAGDTVRLAVTLRDAAGDAHHLAHGALSLRIGAETLAPVTLDASNATFELPMPREPTTAVLRYAGDDALRSAEASVTLRPRLLARLALDPTPRNVTLGERLDVSGRLMDERDAPLSGARVEIQWGPLAFHATTRSDGRFDAAASVPASMPLGARPLSARWSGDDQHDAIEAAPQSIAARAAPRFTNVTTRAALGEGGEVRGMLLAAGAPFAEPSTGAPPPIRVTIGTEQVDVTPAQNGSFRVSIPREHTAVPGLVRVHLASRGTALVDEAKATITVPVAAPARLQLEPAAGARGGTATVVGRLVDATGRAIAGEAMDVSFAGGAVTATTTSTGEFEARVEIPPTLPAAPHPVSVKFGGSQVHLPATATSQLSVQRRIHLEEMTAVLAPGERIIRARLVDDSGAPVAAHPVVARVASAPPQSTVTGATGALSFVVGFDAADDVLRVHLRADAVGAYAALAEARAVYVERATTLALEAPEEPQRGASLPVRVALRDDQGRPLTGRAVDLMLDNLRWARIVTGPDGAGTWNATVPDAAVGASALRARFNGALGLLPAEAGQPLRVRAPSEVRLKVERADDGLVHLEARVVGSDGHPVPNATVVVSAGGLFVVTTGPDGDAQLILAAADEIVARFPGSSALLPASAAAQAPPTQVVREVGSPPLPLGLVVGAAGGAALLVIAWRRYRRDARDHLVVATRDARRVLRAKDANSASVLTAYTLLADALHHRHILDVETATPREVHLALVRSFALPDDDVDRVVAAFERARYSPAATTLEDVEQVAAALDRLSRALAEARP